MKFENITKKLGFVYVNYAKFIAKTPDFPKPIKKTNNLKGKIAFPSPIRRTIGAVLHIK